MKRVIAIVAMALMLSSCVHNSTYTEPAVCVDEGVIMTSDGNLWSHSDIHAIGATMTVTFDDNGTTENIYDDIIVDIH